MVVEWRHHSNQAGTPRGRPSRGTAGTNPKTGGHQPKDWQALPFNTVGDHEFFLALGKCVSEVVRGSFILVWGYAGIGRRVPIALSCYSLRFSLHSLFFLTLCQLRSCHRQFCSIRTARSNSEDAFLSVPIVHVRMSALSLPTERASPGA